MKISQPITYIIIFLIFNYSIGQNYTFDKLVKSTFSTALVPDQEQTNLFNSKDYTYHMQLYTQNDSLQSRIFDTKRNLVHYFYIDKSDSSNLKFLKTNNLTKTTNDYTFEFSEITKHKKKKEVTFEIFNIRNKRIAKYKLIIKETNLNSFSIFKHSALETLLFSEIIPPINCIVLKAKGRNTNGRSVEYELKSIEDVNILASIPQKN